MKIKIVGPEEDPNFRRIQRHLLQAIHELQIDATLDEVTRMDEIQNYPMTLYPAVYIDDTLICQGHDITLEKAKVCILSFYEKKSHV